MFSKGIDEKFVFAKTLTSVNIIIQVRKGNDTLGNLRRYATIAFVCLD